MLLIVLGYAMVATFMVAIMTNRLSAFVALVIVPIVFGLMAGHGSHPGAVGGAEGPGWVGAGGRFLRRFRAFASDDGDGGAGGPGLRLVPGAGGAQWARHQGGNRGAARERPFWPGRGGLGSPPLLGQRGA